ncbi:MAG TPA: RICIN domain-containing protein [Acidimicrobiales bacterium]|nr:RICIN domain-containing protein [Acidimicrobiales bacterium]
MRRIPRSIRFAACAGVLAGIALVAVTVPSDASPERAATATASKIDAYATYYGWYDNSPPGCATAYSGCAGGIGTYAHPITFASDKAELPVGTKVYYPTVEKYFVMGDDCQECDEDWAGKGPDGGPHLYHLDLWIGGKGANEFAAINCEDALTQGMPNGAPLLTPFIVNPPAGMPVSTEDLFNAKTGHCYGGAQTSIDYGRYRNALSGECLADPGDSVTSFSHAVLAPCSPTKGEDFAFDGEFFIINKLCLQAVGYKPGAHLNFQTCSGVPHQQWEINSNGTIAGTQSNKCVSDVSGKLQLADCSGSSSSDRWSYSSEPAP